MGTTIKDLRFLLISAIYLLSVSQPVLADGKIPFKIRCVAPYPILHGPYAIGKIETPKDAPQELWLFSKYTSDGKVTDVKQPLKVSMVRDFPYHTEIVASGVSMEIELQLSSLTMKLFKQTNMANRYPAEIELVTTFVNPKSTTTTKAKLDCEVF